MESTLFQSHFPNKSLRVPVRVSVSTNSVYITLSTEEVMWA